MSSRPERLADLPQRARRLHRERVVVAWPASKRPSTMSLQRASRRRAATSRQLLGQAGEDVVDVADQVDLGHEVLVDLGARRCRCRRSSCRARGFQLRRRVLDEVVADRDHDVGVLEAGQRVVARLQADGAERVRVLVVEQRPCP